MKNSLPIFAAGVVFASLTALSGAPLTEGNLLVLQTGDGITAPANTGSPIFVLEMTPAGVIVQTIPIPSGKAGS